MVLRKSNDNRIDNFNHVIRFGCHCPWRSGTQEVNGYLNVKFTDDQVCLLNPITVNTITGFILQYNLLSQARKKLLHRRLDVIDVSISSYCYILSSVERKDMLKPEKVGCGVG